MDAIYTSVLAHIVKAFFMPLCLRINDYKEILRIKNFRHPMKKGVRD
jgi:hypothetical protein